MMSRQASASTDIDAPVELVWSVILDTPRYGEWNPFVYRVGLVGEPLAVGSQLALDVRWVSGGTVRARTEVTRIEAPAPGAPRAALVYDFRGPLHSLALIRSQRTQALEALSATRTRYVTDEQFSGPLVWAIPLRKVRAGFAAHAAALKARAEALQRQAGAR